MFTTLGKNQEAVPPSRADWVARPLGLSGDAVEDYDVPHHLQ